MVHRTPQETHVRRGPTSHLVMSKSGTESLPRHPTLLRGNWSFVAGARLSTLDESGTLIDVGRSCLYARWPKQAIIFDSDGTSSVPVVSLLEMSCEADVSEVCRRLVSNGTCMGKSGDGLE
jgi:hypothetical protein